MFCRYLAVVVLSIGLISGARFVTGPTQATKRARLNFQEDHPSTMSESECERHAELADWQARRDRYAALAEMLEKELVCGTIGLREATERLFYYCVQNYPEHLENIAAAETGQNIKTCLARNLLRAFER